ncbi:uncharacterized protein LACBIDRAFT_302927 [Laccaria bicolor S238N-H82]|uniref:Predicted protein n=1 Tax=Laccaria bicolor (strain S238N-H82 / ATCC MYA-4686) TaxID=486041 RepID=B0DIM2_LACBS|nr:uncharacterized protein LACBIDRAFT_302927 [Laccaria bicolor S238N-H82]EDR05709.1 predicted protein [Laccaria bicolor S238N-H82]|eukprot:XP_001883813.1 predicted protein [Laccaria bicolor S238N-H82]
MSIVELILVQELFDNKTQTAASRPKHLLNSLFLHSPKISLMDSFATLTIFFASVSGSSDIPTNADDGGSGNNAYCVVA